MATLNADTTAITPPPSLHAGAPSIASTDIPLSRTTSRAESMSGTSFKLDPNRPKFKVKPREKKVVGSIGGPTESVSQLHTVPLTPFSSPRRPAAAARSFLTPRSTIFHRLPALSATSTSASVRSTSPPSWLGACRSSDALLAFPAAEIFRSRSYFVGSPDLAMNVVKGIEKGVVKVTGLSSDPIGAKRERKRKAALAKLSAMETYGVTPPPAVEEAEDEEDEGRRRDSGPNAPRGP